MKKIASHLIVASLAIGLLSSCEGDDPKPEAKGSVIINGEAARPLANAFVARTEPLTRGSMQGFRITNLTLTSDNISWDDNGMKINGKSDFLAFHLFTDGATEDLLPAGNYQSGESDILFRTDYGSFRR